MVGLTGVAGAAGPERAGAGNGNGTVAAGRDGAAAAAAGCWAVRGEVVFPARTSVSPVTANTASSRTPATRAWRVPRSLLATQVPADAPAGARPGERAQP